MINELRLVRGAVAKKDLVPVLTHFHFYDGRVQGGNGAICIDTPIECDYKEAFTVPSKTFLKAVDACGSEPQLKLTDGGRLSVRRGKFRALLPLSPSDVYPVVVPAGERVEMPVGSLWASVRRIAHLLPYVSQDASRPWSRGVLLNDGKAYATNNVVLAEAQIDWITEPLNVPGEALAELVRVDREVTHVRHTPNSITFEFGDAWLHGRLYDLAWPDVAALLAPAGPYVEVPETLLDAVETVVPFAGDAAFATVQLNDWGVECGDARVDIDLPFIQEPLAFSAEHLVSVLQVASHIAPGDARAWWKGDHVRGVMIGRRVQVG